MGKAIGLLLFVLAVWTAVEVTMYGVDGAFGGRLAFLGGEQAVPADEEEPAWVGMRARDAVESARDRRIDRVERQAGER